MPRRGHWVFVSWSSESKILAFAALLSVLCACAGSGKGLDQWGNQIAPGEDTAMEPFERVQLGIFGARCVSCHAGPGAPLGLDLSKSNADHLVGVPSKGAPDLFLVDPGRPKQSYLYIKVASGNDDRLKGIRMPRDGPPYLSKDEIKRIETWITKEADDPMENAP